MKAVEREDGDGLAQLVIKASHLFDFLWVGHKAGVQLLIASVNIGDHQHHELHRSSPWFVLWSCTRSRVAAPKVDTRLSVALQRGLEPAEGLVPLAFDVVEPTSRLVEAGRLDLPDVVAAHAGAAHQAGAREHVQVLRDGLARDARTRGEAGDRHRSPRAQSGDEAEACLFPERGENRRGARGLARAGAQLPLGFLSPPPRQQSPSPPSGTATPPPSFVLPRAATPARP